MYKFGNFSLILRYKIKNTSDMNDRFNESGYFRDGNEWRSEMKGLKNLVFSSEKEMKLAEALFDACGRNLDMFRNLFGATCRMWKIETEW